ncbi:MAG: sigma-70 family RNA polymerase sigma factor [Oscillospiraceae bacterium]|nr:sigma-70 family RNA polymerase sigma factor [Oscillospiraceae bacterium]
MEQQETILRAKAGDQDAFALLVEEHQRRIYALTLRMSGNAEDAADLAQEAFLKAWRTLPQFHAESDFYTWLYRLATNTCIDFLRREKRQKKNVVTMSERYGDGAQMFDLPDCRYAPEEVSAQNERQLAISDGLQTLPPDARRILYLREFEGLRYAEIAEVLHLPVGTVRSRIARARLALRAYLQATGNFSDLISSTEVEE